MTGKIAIINSARFYVGKPAINKLALAERQMGMTDCAASFRYFSLLQEIKKLENEIAELKCQKLAIEGKIEQLEKLKDESNKAKNEEAVCKRDFRKMTVEPIIESVRKKLQEFIKQKGYFVVIDVAQDDSFLIIDGEYTDITEDFIKFCNDSFEKEKAIESE